MIDTRLLLDDFDATARRLARKGVDPGLPARRPPAWRQRRRDLVRAVDEARAEQNAGGGQVGTLRREGRRPTRRRRSWPGSPT